MGNGVSNLTENEQPQKSLLFWLTSNKDLTTRFDIDTPIYNTLGDELFSEVFALGEKEIGGTNGNSDWLLH